MGAEDDVVGEVEVEDLGAFVDAARQLDVGRTRAGVTAGMVVREAKGGGLMLEDEAQDAADVEGRRVETALADLLGSEEAMLLVQAEEPGVLHREPDGGGLEKVRDVFASL